MLKEIREFLRDLCHDMVAAVRWFFSPHAWRLTLTALFYITLVATLIYIALDRFDYSRETFARCPGNKNLVFIAQFFSFTFFALFSVASVGEVINWIDEKRRHHKRSPSVSAMLVYNLLSTVCGTLSLFLLLRCT